MPFLSLPYQVLGCAEWLLNWICPFETLPVHLLSFILPICLTLFISHVGLC